MVPLHVKYMLCIAADDVTGLPHPLLLLHGAPGCSTVVLICILSGNNRRDSHFTLAHHACLAYRPECSGVVTASVSLRQRRSEMEILVERGWGFPPESLGSRHCMHMDC